MALVAPLASTSVHQKQTNAVLITFDTTPSYNRACKLKAELSRWFPLLNVETVDVSSATGALFDRAPLVIDVTAETILGHVNVKDELSWRSITQAKPTNQQALMAELVLTAAKELAQQNQLPVRKLCSTPEFLVGYTDAAIKQLLQQLKDHRVVVLCGMGGVGKSTLAMALLNRLNLNDNTALCESLYFESTYTCVKGAQATLLASIAYVRDVELSDVEDGKSELSKALQGKRVLLVLDNVLRQQVKELLPDDFVDSLADGSKIIVTSRQGSIGDAFGSTSSKVLEVEVECLPKALSAQLLCCYAFGMSEPPAGAQEVVDAFVQRCAGLPMALEVVGRYLARTPNDRPSRLEVERRVIDAYSIQPSGRLETWRTVFDMLHARWVQLTPKEQVGLLDVAWFLSVPWWGALRRLDDAWGDLGVHSPGEPSIDMWLGLADRAGAPSLPSLAGQPWHHVSWFLGQEDGCSLLEALHQKRLVRRVGRDGGVDVVGVHNVTSDFCKALGQRERSMQRLQLGRAQAGKSSLGELLQQLPDLEALQLRGWQLRADDFRALAEEVKLRLLWLQGVTISGSMWQRCLTISLAFGSLKWLRLQGRDPQEGRPKSFKLAFGSQEEPPPIVLLELKHLPGLKELSDLEQCAALRCLSLAHCRQLTCLDLSGVTSLVELHLDSCAQLRDVVGVGNLRALTHLHVEDCPSLLPASRVERLAVAAASQLQRQVYLSHDGQDEIAGQFTSILKPALQQAGLEVFDYDYLKPGVDWSQELVDAAANSSVFVAVLSRTYSSDFWCMLELDLAMNARRLRAAGHLTPHIIPVLMDTIDSVVLPGSVERIWSATNGKWNPEDEVGMPSLGQLKDWVDAEHWAANVSALLQERVHVSSSSYIKDKDKLLGLAQAVVSAAAVRLAGSAAGRGAGQDGGAAGASGCAGGTAE